MFLVHVQGNLVDAPGIYALDHVAGADVAEKGYFSAKVFRKGVLRAADDDIGLHTGFLEHLDGVLGGLGLEFLGCVEVGDEGEVDGHAVLFRQFPLQLAHRFHKGLGFHIPHCSAYFREDDVIITRLS